MKLIKYIFFTYILLLSFFIKASEVNINGLKSKNAKITEKVELISRKNVTEILKLGFPRFYELLGKTGYLPALEGANAVTIFAPTDDAVKKLNDIFGGKEAFNRIFGTSEGIEKLKKIVRLHIAPDTTMAADIMEMSSIQPFGGGKLNLKTKNGVITINDSSAVIQADILGSNGVVHAIDAVIMP